MSRRAKAERDSRGLLRKAMSKSGFKRLHELGLLNWTIESAVLKFPEEFSEEAHECAEFRLKLVKEVRQDAKRP